MWEMGGIKCTQAVAQMETYVDGEVEVIDRR